VEFAVLHPEAIETVHTKTKDNDTSCVLAIRGARGSATIFGDIERASEQQLVGNERLEASDIVVVPHHGSRTSSTPELIAAVQAKLALIGAGKDNRWGFPKPDVVARWRAAGASTFVTAESGAIRMAVSQDDVTAPRLFRLERRRYWQPVPSVATSTQSSSTALSAGESW
jgi:competence protein ComEC